MFVQHEKTCYVIQKQKFEVRKVSGCSDGGGELVIYGLMIKMMMVMMAILMMLMMKLTMFLIMPEHELPAGPR